MGAVLGMALVEHGRAAVWRSEPIGETVPVREQRIGVWASDDGRVESTVVLAGAGGGCRIAHFSARRGVAKGVVKSEGVAMKHADVARVAVEYKSSVNEAQGEVYLLSKDGRLLKGRDLRVVRRSVPADSPLPIVEGYWVSTNSHGPPQFEPLRGR
jgi:hypothetical protein